MFLRCCFLNCANLFPVGANPKRFPGDQAALEAKLDALAATLRGFFEDGAPHLVGLCEVGDEALAREVAKRIAPGRYDVLWSGVPASSCQRLETGLATLFDPKTMTVESELKTSLSSSGRRAAWMAAPFRLRSGTKGPFWWIVNHWKSQMGSAAATEPARKETASALGEFLDQQESESGTHSAAAIMAGDFNCEPWDAPFFDQKFRRAEPNYFRAVRERALVSHSANKIVYLYCPMWRLAAEQAPLDAPLDLPVTDQARFGSFTRRRPAGAFMDWRMFDQFLVTRHLLSRAPVFPLSLRESTLTMKDPVNSCSDHRAVGAQFDY